MPRNKLEFEGRLTTRNQYTTCEIKHTVEIDGKELPTMATIGLAFESMIEQFQNAITEAYKQVPERV